MSSTIEVRPGEGGADAAAFAVELVSAIRAHLRREGFGSSQEEDQSRTITVTTDAPPALLAWVGGTHRVQRIPKGAAARHTSTATVAVLDPEQARRSGQGGELGGVRIDRYRGRGSGGQRKNKVSTAIRLVHQETGIVITRETGRSQAANLADAQEELEQRLRTMGRERQADAMQSQRRAQVTTERSAKTFTHNEQRSEVVDHEAGKRWSAQAWSRGQF